MTPTKCEQARRHDRAATRMFLGCFGRNRDPATLSKRDWDRFIRARRAGRVGASGSPVSDRTIEYDLKFLIAVFNWAGEVEGRARPPAAWKRIPLRGPEDTQGEEPNPGRSFRRRIPGTTPSVPPESTGGSSVALVLAHETGHRIGAIRQLRWSDIDLRRKSGAVARGAREVWLRAPDAGNRRGGRRLPRGANAEPRNRGHCGATLAEVSLEVRELLSWTQRLVGEGRRRSQGWNPKRGRGWYSLRRKFASDLMDQPLKVLCELGGWKDGQDGAALLPAGR